MNLQATQDNLVLRPIIAGNKTAGGIALPDRGAFEDGAVVISIGPNVDDIAVGDIVVRPDPPRYTVNDDGTGEIFLICAEVDILAKMLPDVVEEAVDAVGIESWKRRIEGPHVPDQAKETEKEKEVADTEEGEVHTDGVSESRVDAMLPLHPAEGLHKDDGDERVG